MKTLFHVLFMSCWLVLQSTTGFAKELPRIVTLAPSLTDIIIELGATKQLVGIIDMGERTPATLHIASVGKVGQFSLEKLISLKPDLILTWPWSIKEEQLQQLRDLGYRVIVSDPHTLEELATQIETIGKITGHLERGHTLATTMRDELTQLAARYHKEEPPQVFYQIWNNPIYTIGQNQIITDALRICGVHNIFADLTIPAPIVSIESVLARNPDIIIAFQDSILTQWKTWPELKAVKNKQLLVFDNKLIARPSFAMLEATKQLCELINQPKN